MVVKLGRKLLGIAAVLCLIGASGCSSDTTVFIPSCLFFEGDQAPASGIVVPQTNEDSSSCSLIVVELLVSGVDDIFGAEFTFTYPVVSTQFIDIVSTTGASLLDQDGLLLTAFADERTPGEVTVVLTRDGSQTQQGVDADLFDNLLVGLVFFQILNSGEGDLVFVANQADLLGPGMPPVKKNITFVGGTFSIETP